MPYRIKNGWQTTRNTNLAYYIRNIENTGNEAGKKHLQKNESKSRVMTILDNNFNPSQLFMFQRNIVHYNCERMNIIKSFMHNIASFLTLTMSSHLVKKEQLFKI